MFFTLNQNNRIFESKKQRALNKKKINNKCYWKEIINKEHYNWQEHFKQPASCVANESFDPLTSAAYINNNLFGKRNEWNTNKQIK